MRFLSVDKADIEDNKFKNMEIRQARKSLLEETRLQNRWDPKTDLSFKYDFCVVFPAENGQFTDKGDHLSSLLYLIGFKSQLFIISSQAQSIWVSLEN